MVITPARCQSIVHFTVSAHGIPVLFQIERAVGAGMDEAAMQAISESRFTPASLDGVPRNASTQVRFSLEVRQ